MSDQTKDADNFSRIRTSGEVDPDGYADCRSCQGRYDANGDGWDGECPSCADKTAIKDTPRYNLLVTVAQAELIAEACELLTRMRMGQLHTCLDEYAPWDRKVPDMHGVLREAVKTMSPFLKGGINGYSSSYGITSSNLDPRAKVACDIFEVIRHRLAHDSIADGESPGIFVRFDKPMHWGEEPLVEISSSLD